MKTIQIHPQDNVAVALHPISKNEIIQEMTVMEDIPQGHKLALKHIAQGENIMKYGFPIGHATKDIAPGEWVHTHIVKTNLSEESNYVYRPEFNEIQTQEASYFSGFLIWS